MKIKKFTDLKAWKAAHSLVLMVYRLTKNFPEGFGRSTAKDKNHFYTMALTSLAEIQNQFLVARDLKYVTKDEFSKFAEQSVVVGNLIGGLKKTSRKKK